MIASRLRIVRALDDALYGVSILRVALISGLVIASALGMLVSSL